MVCPLRGLHRHGLLLPLHVGLQHGGGAAAGRLVLRVPGDPGRGLGAALAQDRGLACQHPGPRLLRPRIPALGPSDPPGRARGPLRRQRRPGMRLRPVAACRRDDRQPARERARPEQVPGRYIQRGCHGRHGGHATVLRPRLRRHRARPRPGAARAALHGTRWPLHCARSGRGGLGHLADSCQRSRQGWRHGRAARGAGGCRGSL
mmetsp:Transcript_69319/g.215078  ORF Transcript_69319/g.215078 Transcript_69319/m.215078 type:complete len:205 (+) Transcript_69319:1117-1731(+)